MIIKHFFDNFSIEGYAYLNIPLFNHIEQKF